MPDDQSKTTERQHSCPCCFDGGLRDEDDGIVTCPLCDGDGVTARQHDAFDAALMRVPVAATYRRFDAGVLAASMLRQEAANHD